MSERYLIVLRIVVDDPNDDPRRWPYDDLLAAPQGEQPVYVEYVTGTKEARS